VNPHHRDKVTAGLTLIDGPGVAELVADVAAAVSRRAAVVSEDVYEVVLRETGSSRSWPGIQMTPR
jgi:hypothetical protein